jgi:hypothetical protein
MSEISKTRARIEAVKFSSENEIGQILDERTTL